MRRPDMHVGETWAYREKPFTPECPVVPAEIVQFGPPRSNKVRIRLLGGEYPGLDKWVTRMRLRVPWSEVDAWLHDEQLLAAAREVSLEAIDTVAYNAAMLTFDAYKPNAIVLGWSPSVGAIVRIPDLATVALDFNLDADQLRAEALAFVDRHGEYVGPWSVALRLAQRMAEVDADELLAAVAKEERDLQERAVSGYDFQISRNEVIYVPPEQAAERLRKRQPMHDLVRAWCGRAAVERFDELTALRGEVARLRGLVEDAARQFEEIGHPRLSRRMREQLEPTSTSPRRRSGPSGTSDQTPGPTDRVPK